MSTRTLALGTALFVVALGVSSACSSTATDTAGPSTTAPTTAASDPSSAPSGTPDPSGEPAGSSAAAGGCTVDGEIRGGDSARYIARPATVSLTNAGPGAPPAFYSSTQPAAQLSLYAEGEAPANVIWTSIGATGEETTYTSSPTSTGLAIEPDGSGATVKTTLESATGESVEVDLTVTCS